MAFLTFDVISKSLYNEKGPNDKQMHFCEGKYAVLTLEWRQHAAITKQQCKCFVKSDEKKATAPL